MRHSTKYNDAESKNLTQFVQLVKSVGDTPELIRRIADNKQYLLFCAAAVKTDYNKNTRLARLNQALVNQSRQQHISFKQFKEKLQPVAFSLGLFVSGSEKIQEDYYKILGVLPETAKDGLKKAYRAAARMTHPDINSGNEEKFIQAQNAYQVLSDPDLRRQYDISRNQTTGFWQEGSGDIGKKGFTPHRIYWRTGFIFAGIILILFFITIWIERNFNESVFTDSYVYNKDQDSDKLTERSSDSPLEIPPSSLMKKEVISPAAEMTEAQKKQFLAEENAHGIENVSGRVNNSTSTVQTNLVPFKAPAFKLKQIEKESAGSRASSRLKETSSTDNYDSPASGEDKRIVAVKVPFKHKKTHIKEAGQVSHDGNLHENVKSAGTFTPFDSENMTLQLSRFAKKYCQMYSSKDLDGFMNFFTETATENGRPIKTLFPKYAENFKAINLISYRIEFSNYECDLSKNRVVAKGSFDLMWVNSGSTKWNQSQGRIQMDLLPGTHTYRIDRLSYQFFESSENKQYGP